MRKFVKSITSLIIFSVLAIGGLTGYYMESIPDNFYVTRGDSLKINGIFNIETCETEALKSASVTSDKLLQSRVTLKLFGKIPIKDVSVNSIDEKVVVAGGNPFGIKIVTEGVMVVGTSEVDTSSGQISPAKKCGIHEGDVILEINDEKITSNEDMQQAIIKSKGNKVIVSVKRDEHISQIDLYPEYSISEACYKAGIWVRDSSAGIGTITFYDPQTSLFGGLGHPVCDVDTGLTLPLRSGEVVPVRISGLKKGQEGKPGELIGNFVSGTAIGNLKINNQTGVFGKLAYAPNLTSPVPVGYKQDIKEGKAKIYTTLRGNSPKEYDINIEKIILKDNKHSKNMIIKVTDKELLAEAGGIVQGMSGSPIIQDGKIVGAVTHVFVNDPTRGYAIFIENMLETANSLK